MKHFLFLIAGGAIGAIGRNLLSQAAQNLLSRDFPHAALLVNIFAALFVTLFSLLLLVCIKQGLEWHILALLGLLSILAFLVTLSVKSLALIKRGRVDNLFNTTLLNYSSFFGAILLGMLLVEII